VRLAAWFGFAILATAQLWGSAYAETPDDSLRVYAVNVVKTPLFNNQSTGYGIYLGGGLVITAAHVVGRWPFLTRPHVLIAGQDLPAKVIKQGSFEQIDLALLSVNDAQLPVSLRLRRNPLCKQAPRIGLEVIDVMPERTTRSHIISPRWIVAKLRGRFNTLINDVEVSGSGLFDAERKCLLGIVSAKVSKFIYRQRNEPIAGDRFAGYFVPASTVVEFIPPALRP